MRRGDGGFGIGVSVDAGNAFRLPIMVHDYAGHPFQQDLSRELAARGYNVEHVFFAGDKGPKGDFIDKASRPGFSLSPVGVRGDYRKDAFIRRRFQDVEYGRNVATLIKASRPSVVISGNTPIEAQLHIVRACREIGARFVFWVQDLYGPATSRILARRIPALGHLVGSYYTRLEARLLRTSDAVVVISEDFLSPVSAMGVSREKISVIENWGPVEAIRPAARNGTWVLENGLGSSPLVVYSGTLAAKHDPGLLAHLAKCLSKGRSDAKVVVVGEGSGTGWLRDAQQRERLDNLVILPLQPFERFPEVLGAADVLVAVIEPEAARFSVPSKVLSYLCAGKPIVLAAPPDSAAARTIEAARAGLVVHPKRAEEFAEGVLRLLGDEPARESAGRAGRDYAERHFAIDKIADRFEAILVGD